MELDDLKQKAKINWVKEGDENSKCFHNVINAKRRHNRIHGLNFNGVWETDPNNLKSGVYDFFKGKYKEENSRRPPLGVTNSVKSLMNIILFSKPLVRKTK